MKSLALAHHYMEVFYSGDDAELLSPILAEDLWFEGPLFQFRSAEDYLASLKDDPRDGFRYEVLHASEDGASACLVYRFMKPGIDTIMAQLFETDGEKITRILLVFDTGPFVRGQSR